MKLTLSEIQLLPDLSTAHLEGYINIPKGFVIKIAKDYGTHTLFNPETKEVLVYKYDEHESYGDSPSDIQYSGYYEIFERYTVQ